MIEPNHIISENVSEIFCQKQSFYSIVSLSILVLFPILFDLIWYIVFKQFDFGRMNSFIIMVSYYSLLTMVVVFVHKSNVPFVI